MHQSLDSPCTCWPTSPAVALDTRFRSWTRERSSVRSSVGHLQQANVVAFVRFCARQDFRPGQVHAVRMRTRMGVALPRCRRSAGFTSAARRVTCGATRGGASTPGSSPTPSSMARIRRSLVGGNTCGNGLEVRGFGFREGIAWVEGSGHGLRGIGVGVEAWGTACVGCAQHARVLGFRVYPNLTLGRQRASSLRRRQPPNHQIAPASLTPKSRLSPGLTHLGPGTQAQAPACQPKPRPAAQTAGRKPEGAILQPKPPACLALKALESAQLQATPSSLPCP
jgi:hypothetical protein